MNRFQMLKGEEPGAPQKTIKSHRCIFLGLDYDYVMIDETHIVIEVDEKFLKNINVRKERAINNYDKPLLPWVEIHNRGSIFSFRLEKEISRTTRVCNGEETLRILFQGKTNIIGGRV